MGGTCQVVFREGTPPASCSARGGRAKMLPVEDTQATNKLIGVLVDNIHPIYHLSIKKGLENLKRLFISRCPGGVPWTFAKELFPIRHFIG